MKKKTFPTNIPGWQVFLFVLVAYIVLNATRLGILSARVSLLEALYGDESTVGTYLYCKKKYDEATGRKPAVISANLRNVTNDIKSLLILIVNNIPAEKWTNEDRAAFNRKTGLTKVITHPTTKIGDECVVIATPHPNGVFKGIARIDNETKSHALPEGANAMELRHAVVKGKFDIPEEYKGLVKEKCSGPNDGTTTSIVTSTRFRIELTEDFAGFELYLWGRWINLQHPELAGDWSIRQILPIS